MSHCTIMTKRKKKASRNQIQISLSNSVSWRTNWFVLKHLKWNRIDFHRLAWEGRVCVMAAVLVTTVKAFDLARWSFDYHNEELIFFKKHQNWHYISLNHSSGDSQIIVNSPLQSLVWHTIFTSCMKALEWVRTIKGLSKVAVVRAYSSMIIN